MVQKKSTCAKVRALITVDPESAFVVFLQICSNNSNNSNNTGNNISNRNINNNFSNKNSWQEFFNFWLSCFNWASAVLWNVDICSSCCLLNFAFVFNYASKLLKSVTFRCYKHIFQPWERIRTELLYFSGYNACHSETNFPLQKYLNFRGETHSFTEMSFFPTVQIFL